MALISNFSSRFRIFHCPNYNEIAKEIILKKELNFEAWVIFLDIKKGRGTGSL